MDESFPKQRRVWDTRKQKCKTQIGNELISNSYVPEHWVDDKVGETITDDIVDGVSGGVAGEEEEVETTTTTLLLLLLLSFTIPSQNLLCVTKLSFL